MSGHLETLVRYRLNEPSSLLLDVVRAVSAQIVLIGHLFSILNIAPWAQAPVFADIQSCAVVVFFVLSGFLIAYTVQPRSEAVSPGLRAYLVARFSRIYSGLIPCILIIAACDTWVANRGGQIHDVGPGQMLVNLLMLQDYPVVGPAFGWTSLGSARVLWTLAIEWWLYMAFGWLVYRVRIRAISPLLFWAGVIVLLPVPLYNLVGGSGAGLAATWLMGVGLLRLMRSDFGRRIAVPGAVAASLFACMLAAYRLHLKHDSYDTMVTLLVTGALFGALRACDAVAIRPPAWLQTGTRIVAGYSFTLYLLHLTLIAALANIWPNGRGWAFFAVAIALANVIALAVAIPTEMQHRRVARWLSHLLRGRADDIRATGSAAS